LQEAQFDIAIPGGGLGMFDGCTPQFGSFNGGERYGGVKSKDECSKLPKEMHKACNFRFKFYGSVDPSKARYKEVDCPSEITAKTGCGKGSTSVGSGKRHNGKGKKHKGKKHKDKGKKHKGKKPKDKGINHKGKNEWTLWWG
jgi:hypothetical protein